MKNFTFFTAFLLFTIVLGAQSSDVLDNSILVQLKPTNNNKQLSPFEKLQQGDLSDLNSQYGLTDIILTGIRKNQDTYAMYFANSQTIEDVVRDYSDTGLFVYVEPNFKGSAAGQSFELLSTLPNDSAFGFQWGMHNDGSFPLGNPQEGVDIQMDEAWQIEQGDETIIAVIDSGVKLDHPELAGRLWTNENEILDGIDNDNNGYIDDVDGWNFAYNNNNLSDDVGHGSNIAGVIAANPNNGVGFAGVNWNCKIMNVKMLNSDNAYLDGAWAINAVQYAIDQGAKIINMSWGSSFNSATLNAVIQNGYANGVVFVASMMNFDNNTPYYPVAFPEVIAVGSIDPDGQRSSPFPWSAASGSNFGPHIDVVAPGNYTVNISHTSDTNYTSYWAGTSQAAPHVAGVASLLLAQDPQLTPMQIRDILRNTADDQTGNPTEDTPGFDDYYGAGRLNAYSALLSVLSVNENSTLEAALYPNPLRDQVTTISFGTLFSGDINVYNITGALVFNYKINEPTIEAKIELPNMNQGIYVMEIVDKQSAVKIVKKLVIKE